MFVSLNFTAKVVATFRAAPSDYVGRRSKQRVLPVKIIWRTRKMHFLSKLYGIPAKGASSQNYCIQLVKPIYSTNLYSLFYDFPGSCQLFVQLSKIFFYYLDCLLSKILQFEKGYCLIDLLWKISTYRFVAASRFYPRKWYTQRPYQFSS